MDDKEKRKKRLESQRKYDDAHTVQFHMKLNKNTDKDVIEALRNVDSMQGYIKHLIRADIAR